jgi:hypothetical protein
MTDLLKPVRRRGTRPNHIISGRRFVVTLQPGDMLSIRPERTRTAYTVALETIYIHAAQLHADKERARRAADRKQKREAQS